VIDANRLSGLLSDYDISLSSEQYRQLDIYAQMLVDWNERMNLTAITDPAEMEIKHFLDSLLAAKHFSGTEKVIDVGTGAGFPGMVLKIAHPELDLYLLDSLDKRLCFLEAVSNAIGAPCRLIHARAEDAGHFPELRDSFDVATARAVAPMNVLCEFCLPFVRPGGRFVALKGAAADDELGSAGNALNELCGEVSEQHSCSLPDGSSREIVVISKTVSTPDRYPRRAPAIKKKPL